MNIRFIQSAENELDIFPKSLSSIIVSMETLNNYYI